MSESSSNKSVSKTSMPTQLFGYNVVKHLGDGARSRVYVVIDPTTRISYALKHVIRESDKDIRFIEQLQGAFEVARQFRHPGLRRVIDLKIKKNLFTKVTEGALILELVDGTPLDEIPVGKLADRVQIFIQTAQAIGEMHRLGLVHCDLKPNNILITPTGQVKVIDYGQTCKTGTKKERIQGTPDFISPEQVHCQPVSNRTDIFNLGATMYWGLTGKKIPTLFTIKRTENSFLLDTKIDSPYELNPTEIPEPLSNLVMDCCRTNPAKRPADMAEIIRRLEVMHYSITRKSNNATTTAAPAKDKVAAN